MAALVASAATAVEKGLSPVRKKTKEEDIKPCPSKACPSCNDEEGYDGKAICRFCKEDAGCKACHSDIGTFCEKCGKFCCDECPNDGRKHNRIIPDPGNWQCSTCGKNLCQKCGSFKVLSLGLGIDRDVRCKSCALFKKRNPTLCDCGKEGKEACSECGEQVCSDCLLDCEVCDDTWCQRCITDIAGNPSDDGGIVCSDCEFSREERKPIESARCEVCDLKKRTIRCETCDDVWLCEKCHDGTCGGCKKSFCEKCCPVEEMEEIPCYNCNAQLCYDCRDSGLGCERCNEKPLCEPCKSANCSSMCPECAAPSEEDDD